MSLSEIPHTIHYIWFGRNPKSELIERCIASWKNYLPEWKYVEWTEENYDINKSAYIKEAYELKKFAFASDYARFDILYRYGGIYLDTDVEMLKPIPTNYLQFPGFVGIESNNKIAPGLILATQPGNRIIKEILDLYNSERFIVDGKENSCTVVQYATSVFKKHGFLENGKMQIIEGIRIFPADYFCAYDFSVREFNVTSNTISIHHYSYTWGSDYHKAVIQLKMWIKNLVGINNYRKLLSLKRKLFGVKPE